MPKFLTFNYHKDTGEDSERIVLTINAPSNLCLCYDVTQVLEEGDWPLQEAFNDLESARKKFFDEIYSIGQRYGIQVKTFKNDNMRNVSDITKEYTES
jgi:sugar phosphate isomerase/epimerase